MIRSVSTSQHQILKNIMALYNAGKPFDLDPTYSTGRFYQHGVPGPRLAHDIAPSSTDVRYADVRSLPLLSGSIGSAVFDPPFLVGTSFKTSVMGLRYGGFEKWPEYNAFIAGALICHPCLSCLLVIPGCRFWLSL